MISELQGEPTEIYTEYSLIFSIENNLGSLDCYGYKGKRVTAREEKWIGERAGEHFISASTPFLQASPKFLSRTQTEPVTLVR